MKKALDILEAHVQWFALGLGALFLIWTVYAYVLTTPVTVSGVGDVPLSPGEVDKRIADTVVASLESKIKNTRPLEIKQEELVQDFVEKDMDFKGVQSAQLPVWPRGGGNIGPIPDKNSPTTPLDAQLVENLPTFAPAVNIIATHGRSFVAPIPPGGVAGAPPVAAPGVVPVGGMDKTWASVGYKIVMADVAKAMNDARIPFTLFFTSVMRVELHREEKLPNGSWGNPTVVRSADVQNLAPVPNPNDWGAKDAYVTWAETHQTDILQPPFYQVLQGEPWKTPVAGIEVAPAAEVANVVFDPGAYVDAPQSVINTLTAAQKRLVYQARQKKRQTERRPGAPAGRPARGGEGMPGEEGVAPGGRMDPSSVDDFRPATRTPGRGTQNFQFPGRPATPGAGGQMFPAEGEMMPGDPESGGVPQMQTGQYPIPAGQFNPRQQADIVGWAHDTSLQPGKTYRYQVVYMMKNPIYKTGNVAKPPALANELLVVSKKSEWSADVIIPATVRFFMVANPGRNDTVRFEVFVWTNGAWRNKTFEVAPGDPIGVPDATTNFATGWLLADIRVDPRSTEEKLAIVADSSGALEGRDYRGDNGNPDYKSLKDAATAAAAAAAAATPGAGNTNGALGLK